MITKEEGFMSKNDLLVIIRAWEEYWKLDSIIADLT